jgi:hypothetical protein
MELSAAAKRILTEGKAEIRVHRSGMWQRVIFSVKRIDTPTGSYPVLYTDRQIHFAEIARVAEETGLPVQTSAATAFPKGKAAQDYIGF